MFASPYGSTAIWALPTTRCCKAAYAVSEWAITFVGPIFWICLAYLLLVAELGR